MNKREVYAVETWPMAVRHQYQATEKWFAITHWGRSTDEVEHLLSHLITRGEPCRAIIGGNGMYRGERLRRNVIRDMGIKAFGEFQMLDEGSDT